MRILMICPKSSVFINFRKRLINKLQSLGHTVCGIAFDNVREDEVRELGVEFYHFNDANRSVNPLKLLTLKGRYARLIKKINPDLVFTFMLKPNIYGVRAAKKVGIDNIYSMVEGAGDTFNNNSLKWKLIRKFVCHGYKKAFKHSKKVFFLNKDDREEFIARGLVKAEQCEQIPGIGIDLERFEKKPITNTTTFLMVARLIEPKGVYEYCEAAKAVKEKYPNATFNLLGSQRTIKAEHLKEYTDSGIVNYLGVTKDVCPYFEECSVHVLPTYYREGLVTVNMEASAVGRAIITCDNTGTRETVKDGYSGFIVPIKDVNAIADKMIYFLNNPEKIYEMGENARKYAEENFDNRIINEKICKIIGADR